ncbi:hypothetical protein ILYODFUR_001199 [Ilyodon furcidens]|uniref:Uncharacterized protein n=1 Tax=Ilyodon furcidens TaxID=33524 RepID=A0ABV0TQY5_9TELE
MNLEGINLYLFSVVSKATHCCVSCSGVSLSGSIQPHVTPLYSHSGLPVRDCSGPPGQWPGSRSADGSSLRAVDTAELGVNGVSPDTPGGPHSPNEQPNR